ncbi:MAG: hypothetical protein ACK5TQ_03330, partial [Acetobacteraceae bacterium]
PSPLGKTKRGRTPAPISIPAREVSRKQIFWLLISRLAVTQVESYLFHRQAPRTLLKWGILTG